MQWCVMEASESCTQITGMLFHVEIHSNLRKYDKIKRNKNNYRAKKRTTSKPNNNKSIRSNSAGGCIHITSGLVSSKTFRASRAKTPLTPDKGRKWMPTCCGVELKRPSLIMTNIRWWLHCVCEWMRDNAPTKHLTKESNCQAHV